MASRPIPSSAQPGRTPDPAQPEGAGGGLRDSSPWHWLLLVPLLVVLLPQLYNRLPPELFGIPFFYWYQLAVIAVGVTCTWLVYLRTRR